MSFIPDEFYIYATRERWEEQLMQPLNMLMDRVTKSSETAKHLHDQGCVVAYRNCGRWVKLAPVTHWKEVS